MSTDRRTTAELELETSLREAVDSARARFPELDPHRVFPLEQLADWYCAQGEYLAAKPYLREAVKIRLRAWGSMHPELAAALNLLAKVALADGKPGKAEEYLRHAAKCLEQAQPPRPLEFAETCNHLAELLYRAGDLRQAQALCRKSRAALNGQLDRFPVLSLRLRNNQGAILLALNQPKRALACFVRNLRLIKTLYPRDHAARITHDNNIAEGLRRLGDHQRAERVLRRAFQRSVRTWGWKHPTTAATCHHLAGIRSLAGRWTSAAKLYERSYRIRRQLYPCTHPDVLKAALNAAELYSLLHDWSAAERLLDELHAALEQSGRPADLSRAILRTRLARILLATGRTATAERWLTEAWQEYQPQAALHPLFVAEIAAALGNSHHRRGAIQLAAEYFQQAVSLQTQTLGEAHLDLAKTLMDQGLVEFAEDDWNAALSCFQRAAALRERHLGPNHPLAADAWIQQALVQCQREQPEAALELGRKALALLEQAPEPIPRLIAASCGAISQAAWDIGQPEIAERCSARELALREQAQGPDHPELAEVLLRIGQLHKGADRIDQAVGHLQRGLAVMEKARGQHDAAVLPFLAELCSLRATDGPTAELGPLVERYLKCHQRIYGHQSEELSQAQDQAADWWRAAGDETRAEEFNDQAMSLRDLNTHVFGELM